MNIFVVHSGSDHSVEATVKSIETFAKEKAAELATKKEKKKASEEVTDSKNGASSDKKSDEIDGSGIANVCVLESRKKIWKSAAKKLIKSSHVVLYIVDENGHKSKNIAWELRQAKKLKKAIIILNEKNYPINSAIEDPDPFTKASKNRYKVIKNIKEFLDIINDYEQETYIKLFNDDKIDPEKLFEQYKLFSETSEALVTRRQNVNGFYMTANTAIITIAATAFGLNSSLISRLIITLALSIPAILLNISWLKLMESYTLLNSSKMKILSMLEKKLAASLFDAEWQVMGNEYNIKQYVSSSDREKYLPIIFNCVFVLVDIICVIILLYQCLF